VLDGLTIDCLVAYFL